MTKNNKTLGLLIKHFREKKGYSQEQLAEICNLSPSYISYIETGKRQLTLNLLFKIAAELGFSFNICSKRNYETLLSCDIENDIIELLSNRSLKEKILAYNLINFVLKEFEKFYLD